MTYMTYIFEDTTDIMVESVKMERSPNIDEFDDELFPNKKNG